MPDVMFGLMFFLAAAQTAPANPACALLTASQVTSLIGTAKASPISSVPMGSTCLLQAGDKIITVLIVNATTSESATRQFESKKRIASGEDVPGWGVLAYAGSQPAAAIVGFLKGNTFTEVKLVDSTKYPEGRGSRLKAVVKEIAGRK